MGACVSSHPSSTMKVYVSSGSNRKSDDHVVIPCSPIKEKLPIINAGADVKPQCVQIHSTADSRDFEETFFDSQTWLDSDCESDFMSVNGEFTPSRGNTPVHHNFPTGLPPMKKKKLSELFNESQREGRNCDEERGENVAVGRVEEVAVHGGGDGLKPKRGRWVEIVQVHGCIPREIRRK